MDIDKIIEQDFIIDRLTNSILNTISGDSFSTEVSILTNNDLKFITKRKGWNFNWKAEFKNEKTEQYKLTIVNNPGIIQGLLSITIEQDHIFMDLLESAPFNIGQNKLYEGVAGNLVAYACKVSFQKGFDGFCCIYSKNKTHKTLRKYFRSISFLKTKRMIIRLKSSKETG